MRLALACLVALACTGPALAELKIQDIKPTYGPYGPERTSLKTYAGDSVFVSYTVTGVTTGKEGDIDIQMRIQLKNMAGQVLLNDQKPMGGFLALGGAEYRAYASVSFGAGYTPGTYVLAVSISDQLSKQTASFERQIEVQAPDFAAINLQFSLDADKKVSAPGTLVRSQSLYIRLNVVGFDRSAMKLDLAMTVQALDENGKELMARPINSEVTSEDADQVAKATSATLNANLTLNRTGNFRLRIQVQDKIKKKKIELLVPIKVVE
ncbi:MAG TPA: hypothetical protein VKS79_04695 [Gemmataceae bacterium]|nr:hypothetical protein [Gemmataceae bacterium]